MSASLAEYEHWRTAGGLFDLSARAKIRLSGSDRVRYLNGQVTANITKLPPGGTLPACVTTAKGKLSAEVMVTADTEALYVDAEAELREGLLARLERYIVADDVALEDITESFGLLHFVGPESGAAALAAAVAPASLRRARRFGALGWEALVEPSLATQVLETGVGGEVLRLLSTELTESIRLEAGLPQWGRELGEETLPPEAGLDHTHIDYAKGCYIGQEVISRIKSVGHVNRQLHTFVSTSGAELGTGWSIFAPEDPGKVLGQLTSAGHSFALAKPVALGYLRRGSSTGPLLAQPADRSGDPVEIAARAEPIALPFSKP